MFAAYQPLNIHIDKSDTQAKSDARAARSHAHDLEYQVERLLMITEALWDILKEKHGYEDEELIKRVGLIDLKDGKLDGKVEKSGPQTCNNCGRKNAPHHAKCIYCSRPLIKSPFTR